MNCESVKQFPMAPSHIIDNKNEYQEKQNNMKNFSYQNSWNNINQKIKLVINEN